MASPHNYVLSGSVKDPNRLALLDRTGTIKSVGGKSTAPAWAYPHTYRSSTSPRESGQVCPLLRASGDAHSDRVRSASKKGIWLLSSHPFPACAFREQEEGRAGWVGYRIR